LVLTVAGLDLSQQRSVEECSLNNIFGTRVAKSFFFRNNFLIFKRLAIYSGSFKDTWSHAFLRIALTIDRDGMTTPSDDE
jgi:hypothetical protein